MFINETRSRTGAPYPPKTILVGILLAMRAQNPNYPRLNHKSVTIVANPRANSRCHVYLLDKYIKKLPKGAIEKDLFYCKPLSIVPKDESSPWY